MSNKPLTQQFDEISPLIRLLIIIIAGAVVGGIYRIVKYTETRNVTTLVVGILGLATGIGNLLVWIADIVTTINNGKITVFAD